MTAERAPVEPGQRYSAEDPCPVCEGHAGLLKGSGSRCHGYLDATGRWAYCSREEYADELEPDVNDLYKHRLGGRCRCGERHGPARTPSDGESDETETEPPEDLGPFTRAQSQALVRIHDCGKQRTLRALGARLLRWRGQEYLGLPGICGRSWKAFAIERDGRARPGKDGRPIFRAIIGKATFLAPVKLDPSERLLEVEGETDLLAAYEAGFRNVICPSAGAGGTPAALRNTRDEILDRSPIEIALLRDLDSAGEKSRPKAIAAWHELGVPVRSVHLPEDLGDKADVRDLLARDHGKEILRALIEATKPLVPPAAGLLQRFSPAMTSIEEFFDSRGRVLQPEPRQYLVDGLLLHGMPGLIAGEGGSGKGLVTLQLGACVAAGIPFGPFRVPRAEPVLLISREDSRDEIHRRLNAMLQQAPWKYQPLATRRLLMEHLHVIDLFGAPGAYLGDELGDLIIAKVKETRARFVVLDPLGKLIDPSGPPLNSQEAIAQIYQHVDRIAAETAAAVFLVTHVNKEGIRGGYADPASVTGSKQLTDFARITLHLRGLDDKDLQRTDLDPVQGPYVRLSIGKANYTARLTRDPVFRIATTDDAAAAVYVHRSWQQVDADNIRRLRAIAQRIDANGGSPISTASRDAAIEEAGLEGKSSTTIRRAAQRLIQEGWLEEAPRQKGRGAAAGKQWQVTDAGREALADEEDFVEGDGQ